MVAAAIRLRGGCGGFRRASRLFAPNRSSGRFLAARRWAAANEIPRFAFVKVPVEPKPFYVDFDSPVLVNMFAKAVRRCAEKAGAGAVVTVTEMLPAADQTWLPDGEGKRYTCELRMVVVDQLQRTSN